MLYIGKVVNTHGLKGEVRLISNFKYKSQILEKGNHLYIDDDDLVISSYRIHKNYDMITFEGITDIDRALRYKGKDVYIDRNEHVFPDILNEDLIGTEVYGNDNLIGTVSAIEENGSQEILVIENGKKHYLVPLVPCFIKTFTKEKIELNLIEGLIDEN